MTSICFLYYYHHIITFLFGYFQLIKYVWYIIHTYLKGLVDTIILLSLASWKGLLVLFISLQDTCLYLIALDSSSKLSSTSSDLLVECGTPWNSISSVIFCISSSDNWISYWGIFIETGVETSLLLSISKT